MLDSMQEVEFAPGEGEIPQSILLDKYCEELAFPTIYCGQPRFPNPAAMLSYEDIVNSEIRRRDRRAVRPDHLLFVNKKSQCKQLSNSINIAISLRYHFQGQRISVFIKHHRLPTLLGTTEEERSGHGSSAGNLHFFHNVIRC